MNYPMVIRSRATHNWLAVYAPGQYDAYPNWEEAWAHALVVVGMRLHPDTVRLVP